ncbi:hypothetical protein ACFTAO_37905 [Paenibacillus rhizoplanae]
MKWGEITELHPSRFVLVEAIKASSNNRMRQLEDMAVIQDYDNPQEAWSGYKKSCISFIQTVNCMYFTQAEMMLRLWKSFFLRSTATDMKLHLLHGLPIVSLTLTHHGKSISLRNLFI